MSGPVQILVIQFPSSTHRGGILTELQRLAQAEVVRLLDVVIVRREADGSLETIDLPDLPTPQAGRLAVKFLSGDGDLPEDPVADGWSVAEGLPVGGIAAIALLEHQWAGPLVDAIGASGGSLVDESWLPPDERERLAGLAG